MVPEKKSAQMLLASSKSVALARRVLYITDVSISVPRGFVFQSNVIF